MTRLRKGFHRGFTLIELLVVIAIIGILVGMLLPAIQRIRFSALKSESTNNLRQLVIATHLFHDANQYLPFNGSVGADRADHNSGSWGYQILPYLDQKPLYETQPSTSATPVTSIKSFLCALRGRPGYYTGTAGTTVNGRVVQNAPPPTSTTNYTASPGSPFTYNWVAGGSYSLIANNGPVSMEFYFAGRPTPFITFTSNSSSGLSIGLGAGTDGFTVITAIGGNTGSDPGPATDFGINPYLNSTAGTVNAANSRRSIGQITDGRSTTIFLGHMYYPVREYGLTSVANSQRLSIFRGGTISTSRNGLGDTSTTWLRDGMASAVNQWGSPMGDGGLMALGDGSVRMFPYRVPLRNFLIPDDDVAVDVP